MNRRSFFQLITGFAAGMYAAFAPTKPEVLEIDSFVKPFPEVAFMARRRKRSGQWNHIAGTYSGSGDTWKFYINGKEIDSDRAINKNGGMTWPFQGAKKGDFCTAKSPTIEISKHLSGQQWILKDVPMAFYNTPDIKWFKLT